MGQTFDISHLTFFIFIFLFFLFFKSNANTNCISLNGKYGPAYCSIYKTKIIIKKRKRMLFDDEQTAGRTRHVASCIQTYSKHVLVLSIFWLCVSEVERAPETDYSGQSVLVLHLLVSLSIRPLRPFFPTFRTMPSTIGMSNHTYDTIP